MRFNLKSNKFAIAAVAVWLGLLVAVGCVSAKKLPPTASAPLGTNILFSPVRMTCASPTTQRC